MTTWKVLRYTNDAWKAMGEIETDTTYSVGREAVEKIGERSGAGLYLLLNEEGRRFEEVQVGSRQEFFRVLPEENTKLEFKDGEWMRVPVETPA